MIKNTPEETEFLCESLLSTWLMKSKVDESSRLFLKGYDPDGIVIHTFPLSEDKGKWGVVLASCLYNSGYSGVSVIKLEDSDGNIIGDVEIE